MESSYLPSLDTLPSDVLVHIAILNAYLSPTKRPTDILNLSLTCRAIYNVLNIHGSPHLYAQIFRAQFDGPSFIRDIRAIVGIGVDGDKEDYHGFGRWGGFGGGSGNRIQIPIAQEEGEPWSRSWCQQPMMMTDTALTAEFKRRSELLSHIKKHDFFSDNFSDTVLLQDLWTALWMCLESPSSFGSSSLNETLLANAGFAEYVVDALMVSVDRATMGGRFFSSHLSSSSSHRSDVHIAIARQCAALCLWLSLLTWYSGQSLFLWSQNTSRISHIICYCLNRRSVQQDRSISR
jgi:hypothetical protein